MNRPGTNLPKGHSSANVAATGSSMGTSSSRRTFQSMKEGAALDLPGVNRELVHPEM